MIPDLQTPGFSQSLLTGTTRRLSGFVHCITCQTGNPHTGIPRLPLPEQLASQHNS